MSVEMIQSVVAAWETACTREAWETLEQKAGGSVRQEGLKIVSLGPALPDEKDDRIALLIVHIHDGDDDAMAPHALHWSLNIRQRPKSDPPEKVKIGNDAFGGRAGLMTLLDKYVPGIPPISSLQLRVIVPGEYECKVLPLGAVVRGGVHDIGASLAPTTRMEQIGYRFEDSPYGLDEVAIIYAHRDNHYVVVVQAKAPLRIGKTRWLPAADDFCDIVLKAFFEKGQQS